MLFFSFFLQYKYFAVINLFIETIWDKYTKKSPLPIPKSQAIHQSIQKSQPRRQTAQAPKEKQKSSYYRSGNSFDK